MAARCLWTASAPPAPNGQARSAASRRHASSSTSSRLQNANRTSVRAASTSSWNTDTGTPTTPARAGSSWQKARASTAPSGAASAIDEVGAERYRHLHPRTPQPVDQPVALGRERRRQTGVHGIREPEPGGDGRLERSGPHVGQELLDGPHRRHRLGRPGHPADLPPGRGEGLAGRRDRQGALAHARQGRHRHVLGAVEGQVLVHLVGHHPGVVLPSQRADQLELGPA